QHDLHLGGRLRSQRFRLGDRGALGGVHPALGPAGHRHAGHGGHQEEDDDPQDDHERHGGRSYRPPVVSPPVTHASPTAPVAKRVPHVHAAHGDERPDDYHWLRDRDDPDVTAYLEAENAYADAVLEPLRPLQEKLYAEIVSRIQETDLSVPVPHGPFLYYSRSVEGLQYPIHCRRTRKDGSPEQILIDENVLAEGQEYCALGAFEVSPDHRLLAWSLDTEGDEE